VAAYRPPPPPPPFAPQSAIVQAVEGDPKGPAAYAFLRSLVSQQEVELEAVEADKHGALIGPLWVGRGASRRDVGEQLLAEGLASTLRSVDAMPNAADLKRAEEDAIRLGKAAPKPKPRGAVGEVGDDTWQAHLADEEAAVAEVDEAAGAAGAGAAGASEGGAAPAASPSAAPGTAGCVVSEVVEGGRLYLQAEADRKSLAMVTAKLQVRGVRGVARLLRHMSQRQPLTPPSTLHPTPTAQAMWDDVGAQAAMVQPRKGKVLACLFQETAEVGWRWFRARIEGAAKSEAGAVLKSADGYDLWDVVYVDYGNKDRVTVQRMRPLEASLEAVPPQARECTLALIRVPAPTADWGAEAAGYVSDAVLNRRVGYKQHGFDPTTRVTTVSLWDPESGACLNEELVAEGLARVARSEAARVKRRGGAGADGDLLARVERAQGVAKSKRAGLFKYGEPGDSDDDKRR